MGKLKNEIYLFLFSLSRFVSGVELSFKTQSPDGLLLCAFSPGSQEEFLAIQLKRGRPYFLFDPQVCNIYLQLENCEHNETD